MEMFSEGPHAAALTQTSHFCNLMTCSSSNCAGLCTALSPLPCTCYTCCYVVVKCLFLFCGKFPERMQTYVKSFLTYANRLKLVLNKTNSRFPSKNTKRIKKKKKKHSSPQPWRNSHSLVLASNKCVIKTWNQADVSTHVHTDTC